MPYWVCVEYHESIILCWPLDLWSTPLMWWLQPAQMILFYWLLTRKISTGTFFSPIELISSPTMGFPGIHVTAASGDPHSQSLHSTPQVLTIRWKSLTTFHCAHSIKSSWISGHFPSALKRFCDPIYVLEQLPVCSAWFLYGLENEWSRIKRVVTVKWK